jgi:glycine dehydrogenase subunit 2
LTPFLPVPMVAKEQDRYRWLSEEDCPQTIGRLSAHAGNAGVLLRAYVYMRLLGAAGMERVAEFSTLSANYLMERLRQAGFELAFPKRRATHEFIVTLKHLEKEYDVSAKDFAKRLLDLGFHAPTTYFPLLVPECLLIEPTETETMETLDRFVEAMVSVKMEAGKNPGFLHEAPHHLPVRRINDLKAARDLDLVWRPVAPGERRAP